MKIVAVVVTYNRKELLQECLDSLLAQSFMPDIIIVFNNGSTDKTEELFEPNAKYDNSRIKFINNPENLGGAGGFCNGIKRASQYDCDWIWIMDDDTIPEKNALEELVKSSLFLDSKNEKISFLASYVYGKKYEPMNVPLISDNLENNGYPFWYKYLDQGLVSISQATFVSILISKKAIENVGLPIKDYFIWGDDTEYTRRLIKKYGEAYLCGKSKVLHKRQNSHKLSIIVESEKDRISMFSYYYRNTLLTAKEFDGFLWVLIRWLYYFAFSFYCLIKPSNKFRFSKFKAIQKGLWMYIFSPLRKTIIR